MFTNNLILPYIELNSFMFIKVKKAHEKLPKIS